MPARNPTPCTAWPCPHLRPCPVHDAPGRAERERNARRTTSRDVYLSARWARLRARTLRDQPWCAWPRCHLPATDLDHIVPIEDGGDPWDPTNLQPLCHAHHSRKTADDVRARRSARARPRPEPSRRPTRRPRG